MNFCKLFLICTLALCPLFGQSFQVTVLPEWAERKDYVEELVRTIQPAADWMHYRPVDNGPTRIHRDFPGFFGGVAIGRDLYIASWPFMFPSPRGEQMFNQFAAHELAHRYNAYVNDSQSYAGMRLPNDLEEGRAEAVSWMIQELIARLLLSARSRASGHSVPIEPRWRFLSRERDMGLQYAAIQEDPSWGWIYLENFGTEDHYRVSAYTLIKFLKAVNPDSPAEAFRALHELQDELVLGKEPYHLITHAEFFEGTDRKFGGFLVDGLSPSNYFWTRPIYGDYREGPQVSLQFDGIWNRKGPYTGGEENLWRGPVNPVTLSLVGWEAGFPTLARPTPLRRLMAGEFSLFMANARGEQIAGPITVGPNEHVKIQKPPTEPGLYKTWATLKDKVVAENFGMVMPPDLLPDNVVFVWNIDEDNNIVSQPILPDGWQIIFAADGLTIGLPPAGSTTASLQGQDFGLTGGVQVLRMNGSFRWPVVKVSEKEVKLNLNRLSATVWVDNNNPNTRKPWAWKARLMDESGVFEVSPRSGVGPTLVTIQVRPNKPEGRATQVCFQAEIGVRVPCVDVSFAY